MESSTSSRKGQIRTERTSLALLLSLCLMVILNVLLLLIRVLPQEISQLHKPIKNVHDSVLPTALRLYEWKIMSFPAQLSKVMTRKMTLTASTGYNTAMFDMLFGTLFETELSSTAWSTLLGMMTTSATKPKWIACRSMRLFQLKSRSSQSLQSNLRMSATHILALVICSAALWGSSVAEKLVASTNILTSHWKNMDSCKTKVLFARAFVAVRPAD